MSYLTSSRLHVCIIYIPFYPILYSKTRVYRGIHISLGFAPKQRLLIHAEAVLTCTHHLCFEQKQEKISNIATIFFNVDNLRKICISHGSVFVMTMAMKECERDRNHCFDIDIERLTRQMTKYIHLEKARELQKRIKCNFQFEISPQILHVRIDYKFSKTN